MLLFHTREFKACWFETGTPKFLVETLVNRGVPSPTLDGIIATEALLFQTGYLSALESVVRDRIGYYKLGYPNREVR